MLELIALVGVLFILSSGLVAQLLRKNGFEMSFALIICTLFICGLSFGEYAGSFLGNQVGKLISSVEIGE